MKKFIINVLVTGGVIFGISYFLPALIKVADFQTALLAALILALVNALVRPVIVIISIPVTFLSLGLFLFVINALMLYLVAKIIGPGFYLQGFWQAVVAAIIISAVSTWLSSALIEDK